MAKGVGSGTLTNDPLDACILAAGSAVAWIYAIELNITIFLTFKRKRGLYFWSLLISSWGIASHALGFILKFLVGTHWLVNVPFITTGWVAMVTGQAFVLYSRLHLVVRNPKTLRYVLYLILLDIVALHVPMVTFTYGTNSPTNAQSWTNKFEVMERIQLAGFCLQETIISSLYVLATVRMLRSIYHRSTRKVMMQLICINCCCIGMDIVLICLEYTNKYVGEASIKPMIYAIKLKLEFTVLNQMMSMATIGLTEGNKRQGGPSHELQQSTQFATTNRGATRTAVKDKPTESRPEGTTLDPHEIYKTQQIDVVTENVGGAKRTFISTPRSPLPALQLPHGDRPQLKRSLMGTTRVDVGPSVRNPRDIPRNRSPTESEEAINRSSMDIEKQVD